VKSAVQLRSASRKAKTMLAAAANNLFATCFAGMALLGHAALATAATVEVRLMQTPAGQTYFDPAGIRIAQGDTVRWVQISGFHSITAYHPNNDNHELRIPTSAEAWDSDILLTAYPKRGATYERVFTVPGVYDYFCKPHEMAGMVGRIVVAEPGDGPGTKPFGYAPNEHWKPVPQVARDAFPSVAEIMQKGTVRIPSDALGKKTRKH
jgi:plastocyanin